MRSLEVESLLQCHEPWLMDGTSSFPEDLSFGLESTPSGIHRGKRGSSVSTEN